MRIEPVTEADVEPLAVLAREIWYAHYPAIIGAAQIEYMLGQRYDVERDTRRMNAFIEARVLEMPEQYYWLHKRFKTRPPGEPRYY